MIDIHSKPLEKDQISRAVSNAIHNPSRRFFDNHGHLPPLAVNLANQVVSLDSATDNHSADKVLLGFDQMMQYHYVRQLFFGTKPEISQRQLDALSEQARGDLIWKTLFVEADSAPLSVPTQMVLSILKRQGLDPYRMSTEAMRDFYYEKGKDLIKYHEEIFALAGISGFVGTQDPFNSREFAFYDKNLEWHPLFSAALRLDALVLKWGENHAWLSQKLGYNCSTHLDEPRTIAAIQDFFRDWITKKLPRVQYVGLSIPPTYTYSDYRAGVPSDLSYQVNTILTKALFPVLQETGRALFLMPEVICGMNPHTREAGDYFGKGDMTEIARLARDNPRVNFWITPLNESSVYEVMGMAKTLPNVTSWGVWWYLLQNSIIEKTTSLGMDMLPARQRWPFNSDARVLEHLIGKWDHFKGIYEVQLTQRFMTLAENNKWEVTEAQIEAHIKADFDPKKMLAGPRALLTNSESLAPAIPTLAESVLLGLPAQSFEGMLRPGLTAATKVGNLQVLIYSSREAMGKAAGATDAQILKKIISEKGKAHLMVACAPSQNERLAALVADKEIDWSKVTISHMDEEIGVEAQNHISFRHYLKQHLTSRIAPHAVHQIRAETDDIAAEVKRYSEILAANPVDHLLLGIGENGHLAYNDPPASFDDQRLVKVVNLDEGCRTQQVRDGRYNSLEVAAKRAFTVSVWGLMQAKSITCVVPGPFKADAVRDALHGSLTPNCPASILRTHPNAVLFLDADSAKKLTLV